MHTTLVMAYHSILLAVLCLLNFQTSARSYETYIVHLELPSNSPTLAADELDAWYKTFLPHDSHLIYSYRTIFKGFAARLLPHHVEQMEKIPGFVSAHREEILELDTTRTPSFLGLSRNTGVWSDSNYGSGLIIGVLDTGITPNHPSFGDNGVPVRPARWRGICQFNPSSGARCNNKLIGARYFNVGDGTPFDREGHGTHVAGIAAGNFVAGANVFGNAMGTAAGIAPLAHLATYKVCSRDRGCPESDILMGMETAISDGVDLLSLSLGSGAKPFYSRSVDIGAFRAVQRGIFVSASAGNRGPALASVGNSAPWILTVGASDIDRRFGATAVLGNNQMLLGEATSQPSNFAPTQRPLIFPGPNSTNVNTTYCKAGTLTGFDLRGKVVVCQVGVVPIPEKGQAVRNAGGAAMILVNLRSQGYTITSESHVLPATHVNYNDYQTILTYLRSTTSPTAAITFQGTLVGDKSAPSVASFSSRGPNPPSPGILKPDIIGPGVDILSAWHTSIEGNPTSTSNFNIISGTSMACPHLTGVATLLKNLHPLWSFAAIKSAIMTTAYQQNLNGSPIQDETRGPANVLALGAGHVNVMRARDPGLLYDLTSQDYIPYLCGLGYTAQQISTITNLAVNCSQTGSIPEAQLNYPSFSITRLGTTPQTYSRTVTNVGQPNSVYNVQLSQFPGLNVRVDPTRLQFAQLNQRLTFRVTFTRSGNATSGQRVQGFLAWISGTYTVRIPILVEFA